MQILGITPTEKQKTFLSLFKELRKIALFFVIFCIVPWIVLLIFAVTNPGSKYGAIEAPVAKVLTGTSVGTAFLVTPNKLLTARHVVENLKEGASVELIFENVAPPISTSATLKWKEQSASKVSSAGTVPTNYFLTDVAVLELESAIDNIQPLVLGSSEQVKNLDEVILIGYPAGDYSISEGNINNTRYKDFDLFKLDATSNSGNSGGPCILKSDNTVIGILVGGPISANIDGENISVKIDNVVELVSKAGVELE